MTPPDRTVHARKGASEIVHYNRAGKWFYEGPEGRRRIGVQEAAQIARAWDRGAGGSWFAGLAGGKQFDAQVRSYA